MAYDFTKLKAQGFSAPNAMDTSPTAFITKFESNLPLGKMSLLEYERRLKKLIEPGDKDCITEKQLIECFKDHPAFKDIVNEGSLIRDLLTNEIFLSK